MDESGLEWSDAEIDGVEVVVRASSLLRELIMDLLEVVDNGSGDESVARR